LLLLSITQAAFATETPNQAIKNLDGIRLVLLDVLVQADAANVTDASTIKTQTILAYAQSLIGIRYTAGGTLPDTGFDCSGFVRYVFNQAMKMQLPSTAKAMSVLGKTIPKDQLQAGDLIFFNTLKNSFSHVGIYIGHNQFIHAPSTGGVVRIDSVETAYWSTHFNGGQRLALGD
jgi:cell wall-associated NlpC family hydrolase